MAIFNERRTNAAIAGGGEVHECRRRRRRRRSSPPLASEERRAGCASDARHFFSLKLLFMQCERGKERKPAPLSAFSRRRRKKDGENLSLSLSFFFFFFFFFVARVSARSFLFAFCDIPLTNNPQKNCNIVHV